LPEVAIAVEFQHSSWVGAERYKYLYSEAELAE
jgi:hypothetical protein